MTNKTNETDDLDEFMESVGTDVRPIHPYGEPGKPMGYTGKVLDVSGMIYAPYIPLED